MSAEVFGTVTKGIKARYRNGVFEPLEAVALPEEQEVEVFPLEEEEDWLDDPALHQVIAKRLRQIDKELKSGQFKTLEACQRGEGS